MVNNEEIMIQVQGLKKQYRIGQIGGGTLRGDLQSWWARKRGKEDPNTLVGTDQRLIGQTFMALNGLDFTIKKGEAVGIIGSNGAGKSTLLKILTHVTAPTEGTVDMYGRVASMLEVGTGFHPEMTGRENVYLNGAILGMTKAEIDAKMEDIIEFSEVRDFIDTPVKRYSSGMYVKLAFSVAAHLDSEIMIMDEVLAVGDMQFQKKCLTKMRQVAQLEGKTILYVSHNMSTIRELCTRCIVLQQGKIIYDGSVDEGIACYLATKAVRTDFMDYSHYKRDNWFKKDTIRLQSVQLNGVKENVLEGTQPLSIQYVIHSAREVDEVGIRIEIRDKIGDPLAASGVYDLVLQEGTNRITVQYDLSMLAPGKYGTYFTIFTSGKNGAQAVEDWVPGMTFDIADTFPAHGVEWNSIAWGPVRIPDGVLTEKTRM